MLAVYAEVNAWPTMPAVDDIVTTRPDRWVRMTGSTARVTLSGPNRFISSWARRSSAGTLTATGTVFEVLGGVGTLEIDPAVLAAHPERSRIFPCRLGSSRDVDPDHLHIADRHRADQDLDGHELAEPVTYEVREVEAQPVTALGLDVRQVPLDAVNETWVILNPDDDNAPVLVPELLHRADDFFGDLVALVPAADVVARSLLDLESVALRRRQEFGCRP